jgi:hypothetical protein
MGDCLYLLSVGFQSFCQLYGLCFFSRQFAFHLLKADSPNFCELSGLCFLCPDLIFYLLHYLDHLLVILLQLLDLNVLLKQLSGKALLHFLHLSVCEFHSIDVFFY